MMLLGILGCGGFQLWIFHLFVGLNVSAIPKTWVFPGGSDGKESACNAEDLGLISGWGRCWEDRMSTHSSTLALRIPMDRGAWQATVHGVTERYI